MPDTTELDQLKVPLAELRMAIVDLMKLGFDEVPLGQLLLLIKPLTRAETPEEYMQREGWQYMGSASDDA